MLVGIDINNFGEEKVLSSIRSMQEFSDQNFDQNFLETRSKMSRIITAAKIYVLDHYQEVEDWNYLYLNLHHNAGRQRFCLKNEEKIKKIEEERIAKLTGSAKKLHDHIAKQDSEKPAKGSNTLRKLLEESKKESIEIETVTDVVYDWTDGDFSLTINGKPYLWIDGESVIDIANYIEKNKK
jgi:hypothetical protein